MLGIKVLHALIKHMTGLVKFLTTKQFPTLLNNHEDVFDLFWRMVVTQNNSICFLVNYENTFLLFIITIVMVTVISWISHFLNITIFVIIKLKFCIIKYGNIKSYPQALFKPFIRRKLLKPIAKISLLLPRYGNKLLLP